jgi:hypothetical protein
MRHLFASDSGMCLWGREMEDVRGKYVSPAIDQLAFNCPHCGAFAKQLWHSVHADQLTRDAKPFLVTAEGLEELKKGLKPEQHKETVEWAERMARGRPFLTDHQDYRYFDVNDVSTSSCFNCDEICIWIHDQLVGPSAWGAHSPTSTFRLMCGATTRKQAQYWTPRHAGQPLSFVWQYRSYARSLVRAGRT